MGRPPLGKVAMTSTERWRRWYAKHRQGKTNALNLEIAALREQVATLTRERDKLRRSQNG